MLDPHQNSEKNDLYSNKNALENKLNFIEIFSKTGANFNKNFEKNILNFDKKILKNQQKDTRPNRFFWIYINLQLSLRLVIRLTESIFIGIPKTIPR